MGLVYTLLPQSLGKVKQTWVGVWAISSNNGVTLGKLILLHLHFLICKNEDDNSYLEEL